MTTDDSKAALALAGAMLEVEDADGPGDVESVAAAILGALNEAGWTITLIQGSVTNAPPPRLVEELFP